MKEILIILILLISSCGGSKNSDNTGSETNKNKDVMKKNYLFSNGDDSIDFNNIEVKIYEDVLDSGEGNDDVVLPDNSVLYDKFKFENKTFYSGNGDDIIHLGNVGYLINSGEGDDTIKIGYSNSSIECGEGQDTLDYSQLFYSISVDLDLGQVTKNTKEDSISNCENIIGTSNLDYIYGNDYSNVLNGVSGDDVINGYGGDDIIIAPLGNATMNGGTGYDTISFENMYEGIVFNLNLSNHDIGEYEQNITNFENVIDSDLDDIITGDGGSNILTSRLGNDILTGGSGTDTFSIELLEDEDDQLVTIEDYTSVDSLNFVLYDTNGDEIVDESDFTNEINEIYSFQGDLYIDFDYSSRTVRIKNYGNMGINNWEMFKSNIHVSFRKAD